MTRSRSGDRCIPQQATTTQAALLGDAESAAISAGRGPELGLIRAVVRVRIVGVPDQGFTFMLVEIADDDMNVQVISDEGKTVDSGVLRRLLEPAAASPAS